MSEAETRAVLVAVMRSFGNTVEHSLHLLLNLLTLLTVLRVHNPYSAYINYGLLTLYTCKYTLPTCMHTHIYKCMSMYLRTCIHIYTAFCISSIRFAPSGLRRLALQRWRQAIDVSRQWHAMNDQAWGVDSTWVDGLEGWWVDEGWL